MDTTSAQPRFTFGLTHLMETNLDRRHRDGLFGVAEVIANAANFAPATVNARDITWRSLLQRAMISGARGAILRGRHRLILRRTAGAGAVLASIMAYTIEKQVAAEPGRFGRAPSRASSRLKLPPMRRARLLRSDADARAAPDPITA